ncbi:MAG: tyrosine-type recombinase/integrase [Bacteroidales bacterium]|nr:tyrosine-type recombinase/integrase [Bacteroidales bacterium]MDD2636138.1 tyrosine-type recombinase/integrase [Bacteroidales bacterium]MDD4216308.1 tyrosine-type recombinase/integrase [Bacteroidales bacterium]MDY0140857.1 tyrosine-type recombinase/integrase [Bacteroidales bacterium]
MNIEIFIKYLKYEKRYSIHTIKSYETDLNQFRSFVYEHCSCSEKDDVACLNYQNIRLWIVELSLNNISARTINRKLSCLKSFLKYLRKQNIIDDDPMAKIISPKNKKRLPEFVQENQMNKLEASDVYTDDFSGVRDRFIIEMFYNTGMRLSELINIKHVDISFSDLTVKILGKRNKERVCPLNSYTINIYKNYIDKKSERGFGVSKENWLFVTDKGNKMYSKFVYLKVVHYLSKVTVIDKKSPHVLRHTFATHMLNHGADLNAIKELLGHANLAATQVYTHNTFGKIKDVYKQAHPRA